MKLAHIKYEDLNARQKERYNFQKIAGLLADYGYSSIKLDDDWQGADFLAQHIDGSTLKIQLKSCLTFDKKYLNKNIFITFPFRNDWYLFDHDERLQTFLATFSETMAKSSSWLNKGIYYWTTNLSPQILELLAPYKLTPAKHYMPALNTINSDESKGKDESTSTAESFSSLSTSGRNRGKISLYLDEEPYEQNFPKADIGRVTVQLLLEKGLINESVFNFLREDRSCGYQLIKKKQEIEAKELRKYPTQKAPGLVYDGEEYYIVRNWGDNNIYRFINKITERFPEIKYSK